MHRRHQYIFSERQTKQATIAQEEQFSRAVDESRERERERVRQRESESMATRRERERGRRSVKNNAREQAMTAFHHRQDNTPVVPLAAILVCRVLPCRLDANFEQVVVGARVKTRRRADIVEDAPEILYHVKRRNLRAPPPSATAGHALRLADL